MDEREQETSLNGAQVTAMVEILKDPALNNTTKATALKIAFNLTEEQVNEFIKTLGE